MAEEEDLRQSPSKSREERTRYDQDEAGGVEFCFASDHHHDAGGHGGNNGAELPGGLLEAEEECEEQDEGERGRFAHGEEGKCYEAERGVAETDVERCCGATGKEACCVEERCHERFGRCISISNVRCWDFWAKTRADEENERGEGELDEHMKRRRKKREVEVEMLGAEHPFVILQNAN